MSALYENQALLDLTGGFLHPGGRALTEKAIDVANLHPRERILDVGCGIGATVALLRARGMEAFGIDGSEELVRRAASPYVTLGDGCRIAGQYRAVLLQCVFGLLQDKDGFLRTAGEALGQDGRLIFCELYRKGESDGSLPVASCVNGLPDKAGFFRLLEKAGYESLLWQEEQEALRSFLATLIMAFGTAEAFLCDLTGGCGAFPQGMRLGYALSVWRRQL